MSMIRCDYCSDIFDSDEDPDCFVEPKVICENCRERLQELREFSPEQQAFIDAAESEDPE